MSREIVHTWEATDSLNRNQKIREHADGHFTVISYTFMGVRASYGPFDAMDAAKSFLYRFDKIPLDAWQQVN